MYFLTYNDNNVGQGTAVAIILLLLTLVFAVPVRALPVKGTPEMQSRPLRHAALGSAAPVLAGASDRAGAGGRARHQRFRPLRRAGAAAHAALGKLQRRLAAGASSTYLLNSVLMTAVKVPAGVLVESMAAFRAGVPAAAPAQPAAGFSSSSA